MHLAIAVLWIAVVVCCTLMQCGQAWAQKRVALVVGNSAYLHSPSLTNPKNDASDISSVLRQQGFEVVDGLDLGKQAFDRKIRDFANALQGAEVGLFFFAGHGIQVGGQNYLVPIDAELTTAAALEFEMVKVDVVHRVMERLTNTNLLFLDACRDNPLSRNLARAMGTRSADIGRGLAPVESGIGTLISFSTQPGNVALDGTGRNSPFAAALIKHIAASKDDLSAILIDVRNDVMKETQRKQVPWEHSALTGRFYFAARPPVVPPVVPPPAAAQPPAAAPAPPPPPQSSPLVEAERVWPAVKDSNSIPVLEAFASRYSTTFYANMAKARVEELKRQQAAPAPPPPQPPPSAPPAQSSQLSEAEQVWPSLKNTTNIAVLENFAARYSNTFYANMARSRIEELKRQQTALNVPPPPPPLSSAASKPSNPAQSQSAWVKLCDTPTSRSPDMFGQEQVVGKHNCLTHHERLDGNTGKVLVAAGLRHVQGQLAQQFSVLVPLGMQQPPGTRLQFFPQDLWDKVSKSVKLEKSEEARLRPLALQYARCTSEGCVVETEATAEFIANLRTHVGLMVYAINASGQALAFPIPLTGFTEALDGAPTDNTRYRKARNDLLQQIQERKRQLDLKK